MSTASAVFVIPVPDLCPQSLTRCAPGVGFYFATLHYLRSNFGWVVFTPTELFPWLGAHVLGQNNCFSGDLAPACICDMVSLTSSWGPHKAHTNRLFHIFRHFQREWLLPQWSISTRFLSSPKKNFKRHSVLTFLFIDLKLKDIHFYEFHVFSECFIIVEGNRRGEGGWRSWASCLDSVTVISVNNSFKLQPQTTFFFLLLFFAVTFCLEFVLTGQHVHTVVFTQTSWNKGLFTNQLNSIIS